MFLVVYARIYGTCFVDGVVAIARNLWTLLLPMALVTGFLIAAWLVRPLGFAGGFLLAFVQAALCSVYSYFLGMIVSKRRAGLHDLAVSARTYLWSWMNLFFVLFMIHLGFDIALKMNPEGPKLLNILFLMELVVLNAAPEAIYLRGMQGGIDTIRSAFDFLQENWIEWFVPNVLVLAGVWFVLNGALDALPLPLSAVLGGTVLHVVMVFRGFLFHELDGSTHRQRMYKFRGKL
jgi:hypothetical protein